MGDKLENLMESIKEGLENLITLEIITAVGNVKFQSDDKSENLPDIDETKDPKVILTKINLIQGDIKTVYNPEFVTGEYQDLKEFHKQREEQGYQIIEKNINLLKKLFNVAKELSPTT